MNKLFYAYKIEVNNRDFLSDVNQMYKVYQPMYEHRVMRCFRTEKKQMT